VDVDEHDVGLALADHLDRGVDLRRLADDLDLVAELCAHPTAEEVVVVDEEHAQVPVVHEALRGMPSSTSLPSPGRERTTAFPP